MASLPRFQKRRYRQQGDNKNPISKRRVSKCRVRAADECILSLLPLLFQKAFCVKPSFMSKQSGNETRKVKREKHGHLGRTTASTRKS